MNHVIDQDESETLDSIRGMAAFVVLLMHVKQWFICPLIGWHHPSVAVTSHLAHFAVLVFFALSGYVITHSLVLNTKRGDGSIDARSYVRSRLARILPPAWAAASFSLLVAALILGFEWHGAESFRTEQDQWVERESISLRSKDVVATLLLSNGIIPGTKAINNNAPMWSLSLEFWAYFVALFVAVAATSMVRRDRRSRFVGAIHLVALLLILALLASQPLMVLQYFFYWAIGAVFYLRHYEKRRGNILLGSIVLFGVGCAFRCFGIDESWTLLFENAAAGLWGVPIKGALLVLLTATIPIVRQLPSRRAFAILSRSSYTLYLFHYPMLCLVFSLLHLEYLTWNFATRAVFLLLLTIVLLVVCHLLARPLENK